MPWLWRQSERTHGQCSLRGALKTAGCRLTKQGSECARLVSRSTCERPGFLTNIRKELVLAYIRNYHPSTIRELEARLNQEGIRSSEEDLFEILRDLQRSGLISLGRIRYESLTSFLTQPGEAWWVYAIISVSIVEVLLVVFQTQTGALLGLRILFGLGLLGFLPGYSTLRCLFPSDQLSQLEGTLLSIFLSVVVSIALGVILGVGYLLTGISSVTLLSSYTVALTLLAAHRRRSFQRAP